MEKDVTHPALCRTLYSYPAVAGDGITRAYTTDGENNFPSLRGKSTHWENCLSTAFTSQNLNETWYTFIRHIDERILFELGALSDLFDTRGAHSTIDVNEIDSLLNLREEIWHSDLSSALKQQTQIQEAPFCFISHDNL
ncbi:hypothetical protein [Yokenella regensburgei]|uniref:hypothetical protein n=1 Tax=Yokenella regensburgei TaxID=158877 RepID=UPI0013762561|nr:hypothetical protein [Yokenella regensburgei]KAF1366645.1 hypothetical protein FHR25_004879 [Yokenella regensburgei]